MKNKMIYVVFSATPLKIGTMIRFVTRGQYNHVSFSFDPRLKTLYSYARYHKSAPFYGGFVKESPARYKNKDIQATVFVCALPVDEQKYNLIQKRIRAMEQSPYKYRYNLLSAATSPLSKRVIVPDCYTCIEFVVSLLSMAFDGFCETDFYEIEELRKKLMPYCVYSGRFPDIERAEYDFNYEKHLGLFRASILTLSSQKELLKAFVNRKQK